MRKPSPKLPPLQGKCRPRCFTTDARALACEALHPAKQGSTKADGILYGLVLVLLLAGLSTCTSARQAAQHRHRAEHATPADLRGWHWADDEND